MWTSLREAVTIVKPKAKGPTLGNLSLSWGDFHPIGNRVWLASLVPDVAYARRGTTGLRKLEIFGNGRFKSATLCVGELEISRLSEASLAQTQTYFLVPTQECPLPLVFQDSLTVRLELEELAQAIDPGDGIVCGEIVRVGGAIEEWAFEIQSELAVPINFTAGELTLIDVPITQHPIVGFIFSVTPQECTMNGRREGPNNLRVRGVLHTIFPTSGHGTLGVHLTNVLSVRNGCASLLLPFEDTLKTL